MKAIVSALISLVAVSAIANTGTTAEKHSTTTTTTTAPAATPDATTAPTTGEMKQTTTTEKHTAKTKVDCKDAKNKETADCKKTTH